MAPQGQTLQQRYGRHQAEVASLLRVAMGAETLGFNTLVLADWDGAASLQVLTSEGRSTRHPLQPGQQALVSVAMAKVLGHAALGLCESERPLALNLDETERNRRRQAGELACCIEQR